MAELWERQPTETTKAYTAFCIYRDMGHKRSVRAVAEKQGKVYQAIAIWSSRYDWVKRAAAYDDHLELMARKAVEANRLKRKELRIKILERAQLKAVKILDTLDEGAANWGDVTRLLKMTIEQLRAEDDGEPTQRIEQKEQQVTVKVVKGVSFDDL